MSKAPTSSPQVQALVASSKQRAESLFRDRRLFCAESILVAVNEALSGPLTEEQAIGLASGLTVGLGGSGCLCGAVSGAVLAVGLFLGDGARAGSRKQVRQAAADIHTAFKGQFKSTCCRVLTKSVKDDQKAHAAQCAMITAEGAALAVAAILARKPELASGRGAPSRRAAPVCGRIKWLLSFFCR